MVGSFSKSTLKIIPQLLLLFFSFRLANVLIIWVFFPTTSWLGNLYLSRLARAAGLWDLNVLSHLIWNISSRNARGYGSSQLNCLLQSAHVHNYSKRTLKVILHSIFKLHPFGHFTNPIYFQIMIFIFIMPQTPSTFIIFWKYFSQVIKIVISRN